MFDVRSFKFRLTSRTGEKKLTPSKIGQGQIGVLLRANTKPSLHRLEALQKTKTLMPSPFHLLDRWKAVSAYQVSQHEKSFPVDATRKEDVPGCGALRVSSIGATREPKERRQLDGVVEWPCGQRKRTHCSGNGVEK